MCETDFRENSFLGEDSHLKKNLAALVHINLDKVHMFLKKSVQKLYRENFIIGIQCL